MNTVKIKIKLKKQNLKNNVFYPEFLNEFSDFINGRFIEPQNINQLNQLENNVDYLENLVLINPKKIGNYIKKANQESFNFTELNNFINKKYNNKKERSLTCNDISFFKKVGKIFHIYTVKFLDNQEFTVFPFDKCKASFLKGRCSIDEQLNELRKIIFLTDRKTKVCKKIHFNPSHSEDLIKKETLQSIYIYRILELYAKEHQTLNELGYKKENYFDTVYQFYHKVDFSDCFNN